MGLSEGHSEGRIVVLDVNGTLVDTNYHHALAWHRALRAHDQRVPVWKVHRHIGMGGDQILDSLIGEEAAAAQGDAIRAAEAKARLAVVPPSPVRDALEAFADIVATRSA